MVTVVKPAPIFSSSNLKRELEPAEAGTLLAACSSPIEFRALHLPLYAGVGLYEIPGVRGDGWNLGRISFRGHYGRRAIPTHIALEAEREHILSSDPSPDELLEAAVAVEQRAGIAFTFHTLLTTMSRRLQAAGVPGAVRASLLGLPSARAVDWPFPVLRDAIDQLSYR
jgi:hypothetical protein